MKRVFLINTKLYSKRWSNDKNLLKKQMSFLRQPNSNDVDARLGPHTKNYFIRPIQNGMGEELYSKPKKIIKVRKLLTSSPTPSSNNIENGKTYSATGSINDNEKLQPTISESSISSSYGKRGEKSNAPSSASEHSGKNLYRDDSKPFFQTFENPLDDEVEVQVIDLEKANSKDHPFFLLFPKLKQEGINVDNLTRTMSTTDLTKLLVGQMPEFDCFQIPKMRSQRRNAFDLTALWEGDESLSGDSLKEESPQRKEKGKKPIATVMPKVDSADADVSDDDD